ncbi:hypothetical protein LCGC14_0761390 [marine sediment metagenome]|uniref:Uncharacterized protein n=1 Tax=marine sediment metagenome TaxID=412755 RepID=A0A0F9T829_9ZZZZ
MNSDPIYLTGYDDTGARVVTALQQLGHWTLNEAFARNQQLPHLRDVLAAMKAQGATLIVAAPRSMARNFIKDITRELSEP